MFRTNSQTTIICTNYKPRNGGTGYSLAKGKTIRMEARKQICSRTFEGIWDHWLAIWKSHVETGDLCIEILWNPPTTGSFSSSIIGHYLQWLPSQITRTTAAQKNKVTQLHQRSIRTMLCNYWIHILHICIILKSIYEDYIYTQMSIYIICVFVCVFMHICAESCWIHFCATCVWARKKHTSIYYTYIYTKNNIKSPWISDVHFHCELVWPSPWL